MVSGAPSRSMQLLLIEVAISLMRVLFYATDKEAQQKDRDNIMKSKNVSAAWFVVSFFYLTALTR